MLREYQKLDQFVLPKGFRGRTGVVVQLWWLVQATLFSWSPQFMYSWRRFLLQLFGAKVGKGLKIRSSARITYPWKVKIGDRVWIGDDAVLYCLGDIEVGSDVVISQRSYLCAGTHNYKKCSFDIIAEGITIQDQVWIATDVFISPGVTIGRGTLVGARSSVFESIGSGKVCFGSPAKVVRDR